MASFELHKLPPAHADVARGGAAMCSCSIAGSVAEVHAAHVTGHVLARYRRLLACMLRCDAAAMYAHGMHRACCMGARGSGMRCGMRAMQRLLARTCSGDASRAVAYPGGGCDGKVMRVLLGEVYVADRSELRSKRLLQTHSIVMNFLLHSLQR